MSLDRQQVSAFLERYRQTWEAWDVEGFTELFSDQAVYVDHPTDAIAIGKDAVADFLRSEGLQQGQVSVELGNPIIDGNRVAVEYWVTRTNGNVKATLTGCLLAQLDADGRCARIHEYWFDIPGQPDRFAGWGL
jgi:uncharacterized protein (TIGR02246 family)